MQTLHAKGFTLIELLVVIAIIAILAAILFPVFAKAREKARQSKCTNSQRQINIATSIYAQDHDETMPEAATVWQDIKLDKGTLICPSKGDRPNGYVYSNTVAGKALGNIEYPTTDPVTGDGFHAATDETSYYKTTYVGVAYETKDYELRHGKRVIVSYADGHVSLSQTAPAVSGLPNKGTGPIPTNLAIWLAANNIAAAGNVTTWPAGAGTTVSATGTAGRLPTMVAGVLNGLPVVRFSGAQDMTTTYTLGGSEITLFLVAKGSDYQSAIRAQSGQYLVYPWYGGFINELDGGVGAPVNAGLVTGAWNIGCAVYKSNTTNGVRTYNNGTLVAQRNTGAGGIPASWVRFGSYNGGSEFTNADIAEILVYSAALSDADRQSVESYLRGKYGL